jgi:hypothetical protein
MKFSVSKDKLLEGLSTVQNVVRTRTTLPILSNVLLQASDGEMRLTTTELDVGVRGSVSMPPHLTPCSLALLLFSAIESPRGQVRQLFYYIGTDAFGDSQIMISLVGE